MLEILIQFVNDGKQFIYGLIRKIVNYKSVIGSSVELDPCAQDQFRQFIIDNGGKDKNYAFCVLVFKGNGVWDLLLLNKQFKLIYVFQTCSNTVPLLNSLDKSKTYFMRR